MKAEENIPPVDEKITLEQYNKSTNEYREGYKSAERRYKNKLQQQQSLSVKLLEELIQKWEELADEGDIECSKQPESDYKIKAIAYLASVRDRAEDLKGVLEHLKGEKETQD